MFKRLRKPITTKQTMKIVYLLNKTKKFLAIIGMLGIVWSSGPMQYLNAMTSTSDSYEIIEMDTITNENTLPSYPTTTDPDFDPSKVAIESEVLDERTATTKTFRKIDGTYELAMYNDIIHFQENGEWVQVDNSLNDLGEELATNKNKFNIKFPKSLDDNKRIKLTMDNYSIDWSVLNISSSSIEVENEEVTPNNIKELLNITQSVLYRDIQNSVDIEYIVTGSKVKENIILNQYIEDFSMTFEYKLKDLALIEDEDGNIVFINENSEEVFVFSDLFMIDNDMNESFDIEFTLVETGNKTYEITITPSDEWLQSAVYPVMIDPSISYNTNPSEITYYDTYVREKYPTSNYSSQSYIKTGYTTIDQRYYGLMYFYIPTPIRGKEITYAYYNLYASSSNLDDVIYAYENTETFTAGSVTWNTIPEYDTVNIIDHTYIGSSHYHSFDLTNVVQKWNDQGLSRVPGITLKKYREAEGSITTFYSEENSITSKRPTFTFGYIDSEGIKDYWTYNSQQVEEAGVGLVSDFTGLLTFTREDTNFTTEKQSLGISMIYDVTSSTSDIGYGDGWKTNYNMSLILDTTLNLWYTIDGTGNKVHYYQTTCDGREYQGTYTMNTCYIAEDGSQNLLIMRSDYGYLSNRYILTLDQIAYNFGTDEYLDSVSNTKFNLGISITRNTTNKNHIEQITDDSGNEIVLDYNGGSRVDNIQLRIKDGVNYHTLERIEYSYNASGRLTTVTYKSDYDEQGLQTSHVVSYDYDTSYRLDTVISNSGAKLLYFYETGNNRIAKIESYKVNGTSNYKFSEVNYEYNFRQTKISDNNGDYILYSFDGFGHTISILDNDGVSQHFKYINPLTCVIDMDPTNGDENDISYQICKDQEPNYFWNNKKIAESSPQITIQNPINNHSFEYDSPSTDENWDFVIDDMAGSTSAPFSSYNTTRSVYGEKSAYIYVYTGQKAHLEQTVVLDQGNGYTLSGFVYGSSSDNTYFTATVGTTTYTSNIVSDMGEWKYVELVFDVPSDSTEVLVKLFNNNSGYSYFDNIQLVNGFRDTRKNVIDNSSFELENATGELDGWYFSDGNVFLDNVPYYMQDNYEFLLGQKAIKIWNPGTTLKYASYGLDDFNYNTSEAYNIVVGSWAGISMTTQSSRLLTDDYDKVFRIRVDYMSAKRTAGASDYDDYLITSSYIDFDSSAEGLQYVLTELLVPLNTAYINLRYEYSCTGIVYFDNLQVYEKPVFTKYYYDDETGQRTSVAKPSGETIESVYDTMDNMPTNVIVKDANGDQVADVDTTLSVDYYATEVAVNNVKSTPTYNSFGQVTSMKIGDATTYFTTSTSYNSNSNQYVYYTKDEHSKYTYYYYNDLTGLLDQIRDANSNDTTYEYYSDGKLKKVKNIDYCDGSDCAEVSYIYDEDRLEQIVLENGYYYELTYDDQDRIINVNINNSNESYYNELMGYTYEMDGSYYTNRISTQNYKNGDSLKFEYNEKDQIEYIKFKENGGSTYYTRFQYEYDHKGRVAIINTFENNIVVSREFYTYDESGNIVRIGDEHGNEINYAYDSQGNLVTLDFKVGADTVQTEYFFNEYFDYAGTEDDFKSTLYDKTVYDTVGGTNVVKDYNYEQSALYRLNNIKLSIGSGFIEQNFTFSGNTTRIFEIKYDFDNSTTTSTETYKYRYYYDNLGNISTVYYYENGSTVMKYNYEYDELNQLIQEDVYEYGNCSTYGDTCYTKYFKYDQRGNITDIKTYDYGEEETNDPVIPSFYQQNNGGWDADMTYRNYYDYQDIYNLDVGDPIPSITTMDFDYVDAFFGTPISGMSTSYTSGNLTTTTAGYYYRYYNATDGGNYNLTFKIVFKVGNPQPTVNAPEEHIRYYYQDDWMDQLLKYGVVTYNGTTEVEPTSFIQEYVYDDQGNPTYITNFDYEDMTYHHADLEYSGRQLTNIKIYNSSNVLQHELSYTYNDQGYRTSKTIDGTTVEYTLSGDKVLFETDGTYGIIYTYDADGKIIGFSYDDNVSSGDDYKDYFYIRNQQGDITKIFRMNGTEKIVLVEYEYDAWGNLIDIIYNTDTGYFVEAVNVHSVNQYFYRGYRYDSEIGLYYLNSRFYDSNVGRFINSDGQLGMPGYLNGHNSYAYAKNNPVLNYDPSGYLSKENWIKLAIGTAALAAAVALTVATGGALLPIFMTVGGGTLTGAGIGYLTGGVDGAIDGAIDGFMWASIFACASAGFKFVQAGGKSIVKPGSVGNPSGTGQTHHIFPKPAEKSLLQKFGLTRNDYLVKANNLNAHKGFQTWHRTYNKSVMTLIDKSDDIKALESGINAIYSTPDMIEKFGKIVINLIP